MTQQQDYIRDKAAKKLTEAYLALRKGQELTSEMKSLLESASISTDEFVGTAMKDKSKRKFLPYRLTKRGREEAAAQRAVSDSALLDVMLGTWYDDAPRKDLPKNVVATFASLSAEEKRALKARNPELYEQFDAIMSCEIDVGGDQEFDDEQAQDVIRQWVNMPPLVAQLADALWESSNA